MMIKQSIGFLEYRSVARGVEAADAMLKSGNVQLIHHCVLCPGKYVVLITGDVGAVEAAISVGRGHDPAFCLDSLILPNVHSSLLPALSGTTPAVLRGALGLLETADAACAVQAADTAAKAAGIQLLEIRLSRGMGGKSFVTLCGDLAAVETAVKAAAAQIGGDGLLIATTVVPSPHPDLKF